MSIHPQLTFESDQEIHEHEQFEKWDEVRKRFSLFRFKLDVVVVGKLLPPFVRS